MVNYLVPKDTAQVLRGDPSLVCEHMGLLLTRFAPQEAVDPNRNPDNREIRDRWLKSVCERVPGQTPTLEAMVEPLINRWIDQTVGATRFQMQARTRLIVGLGGKGTLEFGITLHHTTGLPFIPGSALKGLCRNYALLLIAEKQGVPAESDPLAKLDTYLMDADVLEPDALLYRQIFGNQTEAGACIFYDALFAGLTHDRPLFRVDVMTPHFTKYYRTSGADAPDDGDRPNPVSFVTVTEGAIFTFAVGLRHGITDDGLNKQARRWLREGLEMLGIGAKTAAGYGAFGPMKK